MYGEDRSPSSENLKPGDPKPKYWNNVPKSDNNDSPHANPLQEMHLMRQEQKAHQVCHRFRYFL